MESDSKGSSRLNKIFSYKPPDKISEKYIAMVLEEGEKEGVILPNQRKMISNVLKFKNTTIEEVMTHRVDIEAIEENLKIEKLLNVALKNGFSRIPVYKESIDNIIGIIYVKDLLNLVCLENVSEIYVNKFVREALYVPETMKCIDLFSEFTEKHQHMAIVVDEFGGTSGIVTLEDVLESIVGEIQDEYDNEQAEIVKVNAKTYTIEGTATLNDVCEVLDIYIEENPDYDTISGFLVDRLGRIPDEGEHPIIRYKDVEFTILSVKERHIKKVRAVKTSDLTQQNNQ